VGYIVIVKEPSNVTIVEEASGERISQHPASDGSDDVLLSIPRRPAWNKNMSKSELVVLEKQEFLKWRRRVAQVQESKNLLVTPFEKTLEFWRQLWRVVEKSDVLVQVVDARNPLLFYSADLQTYATEVDPKKKSVVLMNKSDFLTQNQRNEWKKYFDSVGLHVVFFSAIAEPDDTVAQDCDVTENAAILPPGDLVDHLKNFALEATRDSPKAFVSIGLVGYPNVGKSSTINALLTEKKVSISATPGKTKHFQTIFLSPDVCLCDCPGLVFPNFVSSRAEMIVNGILSIDEMTNHVAPVNYIARLFPRSVFEDMYGIRLRKDTDQELDSEELLTAYGLSRGYMTSRGMPNQPLVARFLLKDFVSGKLLHCKAPPGVDQESFHKFIVSQPKVREFTPSEMRLIQEGKSEDEFNREFFRKNAGDAHVKGLAMTMNGLQIGSLPPKGWKKKMNANKREKLRRVFADLDH
jgi:large subunit GTPase 1